MFAQRKKEKDVLSAYAVPGTTVSNSVFRLGLTGKVTLIKRPERVRDFAPYSSGSSMFCNPVP